MANTPRQWSPDEDSLLKDAVAVHGDEPGMWKTIAHCVPGRSNKACRKRWLHSLSPTVKKTPWTPEEDAILLNVYAAHDPPRWSLIAKCIPGRTDDACSKRYREALDPHLKRDDWSLEEDAKLLDLTVQLGSKWTQVGQEMGRSGLGCRNRWRLLERKQRPRNASRSSVNEEQLPPFYGPPSPFIPAPDPQHVIPSIHFQHPSSFQNTSFITHETTAHGTSIPVQVHPSPGHLIPPNAISPSLIHPSTISTSSSLSGALASAAIKAPHDPALASTFQPSLPDSSTYDDVNLLGPANASQPSPPAPPVPDHRSNHPSSADTPGPREHGREEDPPPRKRPRLRGPISPEQDPTAAYPRLSSHLPATSDPSILPYACGHVSCWPGPSGTGASRFATASEVAEHRRLAHPENDPGEGNSNSKPFRCALQGCGKGWKNINGIQYHLQISKAHFRTALLSQTAGTVPDIGNVAEAPVKGGKRKEYACPHEGCTNIYKQRTGLQYHLAHGHPANVAQLEIIPPTLMRKMAVETHLQQQPASVAGSAAAPASVSGSVTTPAIAATMTSTLATPHADDHEDMSVDRINTSQDSGIVDSEN